MHAQAGTAWGYSPIRVTGIVVAAVCYLSALSLLNAQGVVTVSPALIGAVEFLIYAACLVELRRSLGPVTVIVLCTIAAWLCFTWALRGEADVKSARDLLIPLLFISLGRHVGDRRFADRLLWLIVSLVVLFGLFEAFFVDRYAAVFNTFSFYVNTGATAESNAMFDDQMLTLNGFRPEGIGRTVLPALLGQHRVSSLLMEPVSLGNFALLIFAWGLSRPFADEGIRWRYVLASVLLVALADSRFALMMMVPVTILLALPVHVWNRMSLLFPLLGVLLLLVVSTAFPRYGDDFVGRLTHSGLTLQELSTRAWFGLADKLPGFWDMGYAYVLSRFGLLLFGGLLLAFMTIRLADAAAMRFRSFILLYGSAILLVSGTSFFALKTAAPMWFMFGVLSAGLRRLPARAADRSASGCWSTKPQGAGVPA